MCRSHRLDFPLATPGGVPHPAGYSPSASPVPRSSPRHPTPPALLLPVPSLLPPASSPPAPASHPPTCISAALPGTPHPTADTRLPLLISPITQRSSPASAAPPAP